MRWVAGIGERPERVVRAQQLCEPLASTLEPSA